MDTFFYQNVTGLRRKFSSFYDSHNAQVNKMICLTWAWLNNYFCKHCLFAGVYSVYHVDRDYFNFNLSRSGGALIAV
jgi:hypothetical protein